MEIHEGSDLGQLLHTLPPDTRVRVEYSTTTGEWQVNVDGNLGPVAFRFFAADGSLAGAVDRATTVASTLIDTAGNPTLTYSVFHQAQAEAEATDDPPADPHLDR
jgi:hypothetical protein